MKILLTGATGFVGSCIVKHLIRDDNLELETISSSKPIDQNWKSSARHYVQDFNSASTRDLFRQNKYDLLIHAAWQGLPNRSPEINAKNGYMSAILFREFVDAGGKAIVGLGSCLEYGSRNGLISENDSGLNVNDFGNVKRSLLSQILSLGVPYLWLRPFYLYGLKQHSNSLLNLTMNHLSNEDSAWIREPFIANDFTSVEDLGRLIRRVVTNQLWLGELNVGTSHLTSNIEFVNTVRKLLGRKQYVVPQHLRQGMAADLTKFRKVLPGLSLLNIVDGIQLNISCLNKARN